MELQSEKLCALRKMDVNVRYQNDVYCVVDCDSSIAQELSDFFTFEVPGARFMPTVRNKVWDGKIRLFNAITRTTYAGLVNYIVDFAKVRNYDCIVESKLTSSVSFSNDDVDDLAQSVGLTLEPRDY